MRNRNPHAGAGAPACRSRALRSDPGPASGSDGGREVSGDPRQALGRWGEEAARLALEGAGLRVLEQRWRSRAGEIDLIALDGDVVVFVEVKTRRGNAYGIPSEAIVRRKQQRIGRVALAYLVRRRLHGRICRFDVVEVTAAPGSPPGVRHIRDAFRLSG